MVYDTLTWSEDLATAATTLAGVTSGFGTAAARTRKAGYTSAADYYELLRGNGTPYITRVWGYSITKIHGTALAGNRSMSQMKFLTPGSANDLISHGTGVYRLKFQEGEQVSAYAAMGAGEMALVCADVAYGAPVDYPSNLIDAVAAAGVSQVFCIDTLITTTTGSCTNADGKATLDSCTQEDLWLDSNANYKLIGVQGNRSLSNCGGALFVDGLGGEWTGRTPAVPLAELSGVTFDTSEPAFFARGGLPFKGDALPSLYIVSPTSGAVQLGLFIGKV